MKDKQFRIKPVAADKKVQKMYRNVPPGFLKGDIACHITSPRRSGKSSLISSLVSQIYSKVYTEVILLSDTAAFDIQYRPLAACKNVFVHDVTKAPIDNDLLAAIWKRQEEVLKVNPDATLLVILDDVGMRFKSKSMLSMMKKIAQSSRHINLSYFAVAQSCLNYPSEMTSNATSHIMFRMNKRELTKVSELLATKVKDRDELFDWIQRNTVKPYSWVQINLNADSDAEVYLAWDPDTNSFSQGI